MLRASLLAAAALALAAPAAAHAGRIRWDAAPCYDATARHPRSRPLQRRDWICDQRACPPPALFGRVGEAAIIPSD